MALRRHGDKMLNILIVFDALVLQGTSIRHHKEFCISSSVRVKAHHHRFPHRQTLETPAPCAANSLLTWQLFEARNIS